MKEQLLSGGDRAALQGLIPLAGALRAGTIFALFFGGRRRGSGIALFELFAIVAAPVLHELQANDDGLLDITELGIV